MDRCPELGASGPRPRWVIEEPPMDQPMRAIDDHHAAGSRRDIAEHRVDLHALRGSKRAGVVGIKMPAIGGYVPWSPGGEQDEEGTPVRRRSPPLTADDLVDRRQRGSLPTARNAGSDFKCCRWLGRSCSQVVGSSRRMPTDASARQTTSRIAAAAAELNAPGIRTQPWVWK